MTETTYYAVHDPADPTRITYWRETDRGRKPWPAKARYGPRLHEHDIPDDLTEQDRREWINTWFVEVQTRWHAAVDATIDADPIGARARFATFASRCCCCGRTLTDPASKCYAIGPECRAGAPASLLAQLNEAMGRAHADGAPDGQTDGAADGAADERSTTP